MIDISWPITSHITEYKDKKTVNINHIKTFAQDGVRETVLTLGAHTGTHIDAPAHFLKDGATTDKIHVHSLLGDCRVIDMMHVQEKITAQDVEAATVAADEIILFKTKNSLLEPTQKFVPNFVYVAWDAALVLAEKKVRAVGIDYLGIERMQPDHATHVTLLKNNIIILEGLRLGHVAPGKYQFICLPLAVVGTEAVPARAILTKLL